MILCDGNYGLGAYGMDFVHNWAPERRRVTIQYFIKLLTCFSIAVSAEDTSDALPTHWTLSRLYYLAAHWLELQSRTLLLLFISSLIRRSGATNTTTGMLT